MVTRLEGNRNHKKSPKTALSFTYTLWNFVRFLCIFPLEHMDSPLPKSYLIKQRSRIATDGIIQSHWGLEHHGMDQYVMELQERKLKWKHCVARLGLTVEQEIKTDGDQDISVDLLIQQISGICRYPTLSLTDEQLHVLPEYLIST